MNELRSGLPTPGAVTLPGPYQRRKRGKSQQRLGFCKKGEVIHSEGNNPLLVESMVTAHEDNGGVEFPRREGSGC